MNVFVLTQWELQESQTIVDTRDNYNDCSNKKYNIIIGNFQTITKGKEFHITKLVYISNRTTGTVRYGAREI